MTLDAEPRSETGAESWPDTVWHREAQALLNQAGAKLARGLCISRTCPNRSMGLGVTCGQRGCVAWMRELPDGVRITIEERSRNRVEPSGPGLRRLDLAAGVILAAFCGGGAAELLRALGQRFAGG